MSTELESKPGVPRYEAFIEEQLGRVRTRIRALDAGRTVLMLGVVTLAYFLVAACFDLAVQGDDDGLITGIRLAALGVYAALVLVLLGQLGLRLYRRINPYYAARQLEVIIPDAKNSVINWLDLKGEKLPGAIRSAVGQRAARELRQSDPDRAVDTKGNWVLAGVLASLGLGVLVLFAMGPNQFGSLVRRAFLTPLFTRLDAKTEITLLRPAQGNITVPLGQHVDFQAQIEGRFPRAGQPGAPRLLYRYQASDPYVPLALDEALDGTWAAALLGDQLQNGLWYRIAAGDTETPEYQVKVQSLLQATRFEITYRYRPYRKLADDTVVFPNEQAVLPRVKDYRGTEVKILVRANRELRAARIEVDSGGTRTDLPGTVLPDDPRAFWVQMKLEKRGSFRVLFTSRDGEENTDRSPYLIEVLDDQAPRVVLTQPGQDSALPLGGTLQLKGFAQDDIGLKSLALRLKVLEEHKPDAPARGDEHPALKPKVYREGKSFQFDNGTYPDFLEYQDFVVLEKLPTAQGEPLPLKAGMVLEYWLEATDNSDYPNKDGNVGKSHAFKLTILPNDNKRQQEDRKKAEEQQKKHEQKQDQQNANENQKRNDAQEKNNGQASNDPGRDGKQNEDFEQRLDKLRKELDKDKKDENNKDENKNKSPSKSQDPQPGENKSGDAGKNNASDKGADNAGQAGDKKDDGKQGQGNSAAQPKDEGKKDQAGKDQAGKDAGNAKGPGANDQDPAQAKGNDRNSDSASDKGSSKKDQPKEQPGQTKKEGQPGGEKSASKGSDAGSPGQAAKAKGNQDGQSGNEPKAKADNQKGTSGQDPSQAKNKPAPKDDATKAQDKGTSQDTRPESAGKEGPRTQPDAKGAAKGKEADKSAESSGQGQNPQSAKKDADKGPDSRATEGTNTEPNPASKSGAPKDRPDQANPRTATPMDVADLKKKLENGPLGKEAYDKLNHAAKEAKESAERQAAQEALDKLEREARANRDELGRMAKEANDPEVRKAAQDALEKLNQQAEADSNTLPQPRKDGHALDPSQAAKADGPKKDAGTGKVDTQGAKTNGKVDPGSKLGNPGPGGTGMTDDVSKQGPNSEFGKRGGELQLEDLKKRMTPETLKKLGWSNEDWQRFLKDAEDYQKALRKNQAASGNLNKKGTTSQLPNTGVRRIDRDPNAVPESLQVDRALPPPEFREAQRQFTSPPPNKQ